MLQWDVKQLTQGYTTSLLFLTFCSHKAEVSSLLSLLGDILISLMKQEKKISLIITIISIGIDFFHQKMFMKWRFLELQKPQALGNFTLWVVSWSFQKADGDDAG